MNASTQDLYKPSFYAGFYLRTKRRARFWGWGHPAPKPVERPWTAVGDWLRVAHSLLGTQQSVAPAEAMPADQKNSFVAESQTPSAAQSKRKLRFVCDHGFFGLVYR
jgi:hypothetical protein